MPVGPKPPTWVMPPWMEPYRDLIVNTGGNTIEELMIDRSSIVVNAPRAMLSCAVQSQVALLTRLKDGKFLK